MYCNKYLCSGLIPRNKGSIVNSGLFHARSACSNSSEVNCCWRLLASSEATVFLLSLSPMAKWEEEAFEAFFFSEDDIDITPEATEASEEVSAAAMPAPAAFSLFISKAACIAEKLWESKRLSNAAANCCWRICSAKKTPDRAWAAWKFIKVLDNDLVIKSETKKNQARFFLFISYK